MTVETQSDTPQTKIEYQHEATKHFVKVVDMQLTAKPSKTDKKTFNTLYQRMKQQFSREMTVYELLELATNGFSFQVGEYGYNLTGEQKRDIRELQRESNSEALAYIESIKAKGNKRVSTSLIVIDVDDDWAQYQPYEVIEASGASGAYFTFSHREISKYSLIPQNAYRLIYELSKPVNNSLAGYIETRIIEQLKSEFPNISFFEGADIEATLSNQFILGSRNKDIYYHPMNVIDVEPYKDEFKAFEDLRVFEKMLANQSRYQQAPVSSLEYIAMAEFYGKNGSQLDYGQWISTTLGIAHSSKMGLIDEVSAVRAMQAFDGDNHELEFYQKIYDKADETKPNASTIASLVYHAKNAGYKSSKEFKYNNPPVDENELKTALKDIYVDRQLKQEQLMDIIQDGHKNVLLNSPTGSGKTTATVNALKRYLDMNDNAVAYIAMPSKALAEQTASNHNLGRAFIGRMHIQNVIHQNLTKTKMKLFVGTYNKTKQVVQNLHADEKEVILVVDEVHKVISDLGFRSEPISDMMTIAAEDNVKLIGLSGTPEILDYSEFDAIYNVVQQNAIKPYSKIDFAIYQDAKSFESETTALIFNEAKKGNKVLAFVNNKKAIENIEKVLTKQRIKVGTITSKTAREAENETTYKYLVRNERFPNDTQVILTTTVIADGVNILNSSDYVCLISPHYSLSKLFDLATIKQAVNRFRNPYKKIIIPMFVKKDLEKDEKDGGDPERANRYKPFNLEYRYKTLVEQSEGIQKYLKDRFYDRLHTYTPSLFERLTGFRSRAYQQSEADKEFIKIALMEEQKKNARPQLPYDENAVLELERMRESLFEIDYRYLRKEATTAMNDYYSYFPKAFITQVTRYLDVDSDVFYASEYIKDNDASREINKKLKAIHKEIMESEEKKAENVADILTEPLFVKLQREYFETNKIEEDVDPANYLLEAMNKHHGKAALELVKFCTYEQTIHELDRINNRNKIYLLKNQLSTVAEIEGFHHNKGRKSATQLLLAELIKRLQESGKKVSTEDEKEIMKQVATKFKTTSKKVKEVYNRMIVFDSGRDERQRFKENYQLISLDYVAKAHKFAYEEVCEMFKVIKKINS
ncbi:DEAD/DEAH box helicase family protein [Aerococcus urinaeequi]|uniref:DEAD/DEAH box helicase family protein n=1 Tax=Aerococcus urinaeequi TaxID=51665 RepID=UPI003D6A9222